MIENSEVSVSGETGLSSLQTCQTPEQLGDELSSPPTRANLQEASINLDDYIRSIPENDDKLFAIYGKATSDEFLDKITTSDGEPQLSLKHLLQEMVRSQCNPDKQKSGYNCFWVSAAVVIHKLFLHHGIDCQVTTTVLMECVDVNRLFRATLEDNEQENDKIHPDVVYENQVPYALNLFVAMIDRIWRKNFKTEDKDEDWLAGLRTVSVIYSRDEQPLLKGSLEEQFLLHCGGQSRYGICIYHFQGAKCGHVVIARIPSGGGDVEYYDFQDGRGKVTKKATRNAMKQVKIEVRPAKDPDCTYKAFHWFNYPAPSADVEQGVRDGGPVLFVPVKLDGPLK